MDQKEFDQVVMNGYWDENHGVYVDGFPDAFEIIHSKKFNAWARAEKIDASAIVDPKEAIRIIGLYKWSRYIQVLLSVNQSELHAHTAVQVPKYKRRDFLLSKKSCPFFFQRVATHFRESKRPYFSNCLSQFRRSLGYGNRQDRQS